MSNLDTIAPLNRDKAAQISSWLGRLARSVRHQQQLTQSQREDMVAEYAEILLRHDIPGSAYCLDALSVVTGQFDWWPPVGALVRSMEEFSLIQRVQRSNVRRPLQISGSGTKPRDLSEADKNWLRSWQQNEQMNWNSADEKSSTDQERAERRRIFLSMIHRYAPSVHEMVTGIQSDARDPRDWKDRGRLEHTLQRISEGPFQPSFFRCAHAAVKKHAPENLPLVVAAMQEASVTLHDNLPRKRR